jgi:hypothetical protein
VQNQRVITNEQWELGGTNGKDKTNTSSSTILKGIRIYTIEAYSLIE